MKINSTFLYVMVVLIVGALCITQTDSYGVDDSVAEPLMGNSRLMTLEEIRSLLPGFGSESHCETTGVTCTEVQCCGISVAIGCEFEVQQQKCKCTWCGFIDACDKTCVADPKADCGDGLMMYCVHGTCGVLGEPIMVYGGNTASAYIGQCEDKFQCHTVDN